MWTALVLVWLSSLFLSGSQVASEEPGKFPKRNVSVKKDAFVDTGNKTPEAATTVTRAPVLLTQGTWAANLTFTQVSAEMANRTNMSTPAAVGGMADGMASRASLSPVPTPAPQTPSTATAGPLPLSPPLSGGPHSSTPPGAATAATEATQAPAAPGTATSQPTSTPEPSTIPGPTSTPEPSTTPGPTTTQGPTTTPEPSTTHSNTPVSLMAMTTIQVRAKEPTASTVPVPHPSPTPEVEATSPTTEPSPSSHTQGAGGPGTSPTPEQVKTKTTPGAASTGPTPTDMCPLSTQGQYLVVTSEPLSPSLVNKTFLLAVLVLGVTLFVAVLVLFALQAYESYKKRDYTQVDYLINGMYADSEM
uniref:Prostate androgen-regulated mucin-like protein 1 n=1 Tax=Sciurus vulgaris TaxID=55149 RepID=A0A8D2DZ90_SCIVU